MPGNTVSPCIWRVRLVDGDYDAEILCDDNGPFLAIYIMNTQNQVVDVVYKTLQGADYVPVGTIAVCGPSVTLEGMADTHVMCDDNGQFLSVFEIDTATDTVTVYYTELDGTPYVPVGTIQLCPIVIDTPNLFIEPSLIPNIPTDSEQELTVTDALDETFAPFDATTTHVFLTFHDGGVEFTLDGTSPTLADPPHTAKAEDNLVWRKETVEAMTLRASTAFDGKIRATPMIPSP